MSHLQNSEAQSVTASREGDLSGLLFSPNEAHLAPFRFVSKHPSHRETSQAMTYHSQTHHNFINVHSVSALGWNMNSHEHTICMAYVEFPVQS